MTDRKKEFEEERRRRRNEEAKRRKQLQESVRAKRKQVKLLKDKRKKDLSLRLRKQRDAKRPPKSVVLGVLGVFFKKKAAVSGYSRKPSQPVDENAFMMSTAARIRMENEEWLRKFGRLPDVSNPLSGGAEKKTESNDSNLRNPTIYQN